MPSRLQRGARRVDASKRSSATRAPSHGRRTGAKAKGRCPLSGIALSLRGHIEAMVGELEVVARFPNGAVKITNFSKIDLESV